MRLFRWRLLVLPIVVVAGAIVGTAQAGTAAGLKLPSGAHVTISGTSGGATPRGSGTSSGGGVKSDDVPAYWCTAGYVGYDTQGPDTANAYAYGSCDGPIASVEATAALFSDGAQNNVANAYDYEPNAAFAGAVATDYCDGDPGGCYGDNPFSMWAGQTFYTRQGWSGSDGGCDTAGDYLFCSFYPGGWDWP